MKVAGVTITHPERIVFPEAKLSKGDIANYFAMIAPIAMPHIKQRPLSILRCPEGRAGECFFQKHWVSKGHDHVVVRDVPEKDGTAKPYAVAARASDLVALVQFGMLEVHTWGARFDALERPDRIVLDLDPGPGISWSGVLDAAIETRELLTSLSLKSWVKLSGGKGLHVVIPLERRTSWEITSAFARAVAERLVRDAPTRYVSKASKAIRNKRIFVDWLRNTRGATSVAPWSVRAREGAPVSVPVSWKDLSSIKRGDTFTVENVLDQIDSRFVDPWKNMLTARQRLTAETAMALLE